MSSVAGKRRVLVTGAARGIGQECARVFEAADCEVIALDKCFEGCDLPDTVARKVFDLREIEKIPSLIAELGRIDTW
jgi:NAD(P)-dependent dehydrogenase (short-subunit alcohol dehydrogenase family)